ncbi:hypothetical protein KY289_035331 [Solanum tuberosum]|nr:hypothetical protein KY289_035331 [Solanum tuberosum]
MTDCKPSPSPPDTTFQLSKHGETFDDPSLFRSIVRALQYATITRPEISFSVSRVCQYMQNPTLDHWKAMKRILRYLKGSLTHGWAADPDGRRSHHGFDVYYGPNLISWSSRKQKVVARSITEAEYHAIVFAASEVSWIASLIKELQLPCPRPPVIFCDNISAIYLTSNPVFHQRSKHIQN